MASTAGVTGGALGALWLPPKSLLSTQDGFSITSSPCANLLRGNKFPDKNERVFPLGSWGTDTVRNRTSCIHCASSICPAHGYVLWMSPGELKACMERRPRAKWLSQLVLSTLCRGCAREEGRTAGSLLSLDSLAKGCVHPPTLSPAPFPARQTHWHPTGSPRCTAMGPGFDAWYSGVAASRSLAATHTPLPVLLLPCFFFFPLGFFLDIFPCCPNFFFFFTYNFLH